MIVRQRPGTAKGFVFITVEDETGFANAIVTPDTLPSGTARPSSATHALVIEGVVQNQDGVVSIKADRFEPLAGRAGAIDVSHDFHDDAEDRGRRRVSLGRNHWGGLFFFIAREGGVRRQRWTLSAATAGPFRTRPWGSKRLPWQGQSHDSSPSCSSERGTQVGTDR